MTCGPHLDAQQTDTMMAKDGRFRPPSAGMIVLSAEKPSKDPCFRLKTPPKA